jgi:hypothetical protein
MSVAPSHTARPPPPRPSWGRAATKPVRRRIHCAAGSSRVQVVVLAAARLRALHLDPLLTGSNGQPAGDLLEKKNG